MDTLDTKGAVRNLGKFIRQIIADDVRSKSQYLRWNKEEKNISLMAALFDYKQEKGMPKINSLVSVDFYPDPEVDLVIINYTPVAHNTLHEFPQGWTWTLRQCRGIVFNHAGELVAKPFPKFFNKGEHPETENLPTKMYFEATEKKDGHLGIIFKYLEKFYLTTRGSFTSRSAIIGNQMLQEYVSKYNWKYSYEWDITILVEIIHPGTQVLTDYGDFKNFILIGAYNIRTLADYDFYNLQSFSKNLHLPLVRRWSCDGLINSQQQLESLQQQMKDRSVRNKEGYVLHFKNDLRVKFKFETYIGEMVKTKLSYSYIMNHQINGNLVRMIDTLPEEIFGIAMQMIGTIYYQILKGGTLKEKWQRLYQLVPEEECTDYYKSICREFVKKL